MRRDRKDVHHARAKKRSSRGCAKLVVEVEVEVEVVVVVVVSVFRDATEGRRERGPQKGTE